MIAVIELRIFATQYTSNCVFTCDKQPRKIWLLVPGVFAVLLGLAASTAQSENIDPNDNGSQYAWGENIGWINAEPLGNGGPGLQVETSRLTGYMWGENVGWISLSCLNNQTCAAVQYDVANDGLGNLSGYAWGENIGWISFSCANTSSCTTVDYGVAINPGTGEFSGYAWGENTGWVSFSCENTNSCGAVDYGVQTYLPEPAVLLSLGSGLVLLVWLDRRRARHVR